MTPDALRELLDALAAGRVPVDDAARRIASSPVAELGYATLDTHRQLRQGMPEVVFAEGKLDEHVVGVVKELLDRQHNVLVTRLSVSQRDALLREVPNLTHNELARTARFSHSDSVKAVELSHPVVVVTAGTSDLPVAEEALETLAAAGVPAQRIVDVGVAGIHRLFRHRDSLVQAPAVICVAGMEGALASVVGGVTAAPVIAVPTSVGYGAAFGGVAALLGMLTSCAAGLTVVNINNGFGAAMAVVRQLCSPEFQR